MTILEQLTTGTVPIPVILDTDGGSSDRGDYQALATAMYLHRTGKIRLIGVCVTCADDYSAPATRAQLDFWGMTEVPVGAYKNSDILAGVGGPSLAVRDTFKAGGSRNDAQYQAPALFYGGLLADEDDGSVLVVWGGFVNSIATFLNASAANVTLWNSKVKAVGCIGGQWPNSSSAASPVGNFASAGRGEWNIGGAGSAAEGVAEAQAVVDLITKSTVLHYWHGVEICGNTGNSPALADFISTTLPQTWNSATNPVKSGFGTTSRTSWDPMGVFAAYQLAAFGTANTYYDRNQIATPTVSVVAGTAGQNASVAGSSNNYYLTPKLGALTLAQWRTKMQGLINALQPNDPSL